jgi:signal peptidase II
VNPRNAIFAVVTIVGIVLDQVSKAWIVANVDLGREEITLIPGFLSIVHAQNPGAALSLLRDFEYRQVVFGLFTLVAVGVIGDMFRKLPTSDKFLSATLGLILSGALGNAIDRVRQQYVTDFIRMYTEQASLRDWLVGTFGTAEWPTYNVADIALVVGVILYALHSVFAKPAEAPAVEASAAG